MKHLRIALILGCMPASPVLADSLEREEALKLPQTLITGNRQVEARSDSSSASSVFTRDDIDRLQPTSLTDLLGRVPGVQVARSGGRGGLPGIYIRGTKSAQSLVLVEPRVFPHHEADARASGANDILEKAQVVATLEDALVGCNLVLGTSARDRRIPWPLLDPRECGTKVVEEAAGGAEIALVFGREDSHLYHV